MQTRVKEGKYFRFTFFPNTVYQLELKQPDGSWESLYHMAFEELEDLKRLITIYQ